MALLAPLVSTTITSNAGTIAPFYPTGIRADDFVLAFVASKPATVTPASSSGITAPAGWSLLAENAAANDLAGFGTTTGADIGEMNFAVFRLDQPTAGLTGSVTFTLTGNSSSWAYIVRIPTAAAGAATSLARRTIATKLVGYVAQSSFHGTLVNFSDVLNDYQLEPGNPDGGIGTRAGDMIYYSVAIPTDTSTPNQFGSHQVSDSFFSGTFNTAVEVNEPDTGLGNDSGGYSAYAICATGTESLGVTDNVFQLNIAVSASGTATTISNSRGPMLVLRLREQLPVFVNQNVFPTHSVSTSPARTLGVPVYSDSLAFGQSGNVLFPYFSGTPPGIPANDIAVLVVKFRHANNDTLNGNATVSGGPWGAPLVDVTGGGFTGTAADKQGNSTLRIYAARLDAQTTDFGSVTLNANVIVGMAYIIRIPYLGPTGASRLKVNYAFGAGSAANTTPTVGQPYTVQLGATVSSQFAFTDGDVVLFGQALPTVDAEYAGAGSISFPWARFTPSNPLVLQAVSQSNRELSSRIDHAVVEVGVEASLGATGPVLTFEPSDGAIYHRGPAFFLRVRSAPDGPGPLRVLPNTLGSTESLFEPTIIGGHLPPPGDPGSSAFVDPIAGPVAASNQNPISISAIYPTAPSAGGYIMLIGMKPTSFGGGSVTTPSGWTLIGSVTNRGGYGTTIGNDTGNTSLYALRKNTVTGLETSTTQSVTLSGAAVAWAAILSIRAQTSNLLYALCSGEQAVTPGASLSITTSSVSDVAQGDLVVWAMAIASDNATPTLFSNHAITAPGVSFGAAVELFEADNPAGFDIGGFAAYAPVNSGLSGQGPTISASLTSTANVRGPVLLLRIREQNIVRPLLVPMSTALFAPTVTQSAPPPQTRLPALLTNTSTFYAPAVVARIDLFAQPQALAAASAALSTSIRLSGSAAVQASAQAALSTSIRLVGATAQSLASTTADLDARIRMSGSGGVVSAATAALTVDDPYIDISWIGIQFNPNAGRLLQSSVSASASVSANLDVARRFVASVSATAVSSASLTTLITPQASVNGLATAASSLTTSILLAASGTAETNRVLAMLNTGIVLAGAASGQASAAVVLTVSPRFYSNALAAATASAALNTSIRLTATPQAVTTATAGLAAANRFYASPLVQATASAALSTQIQLATSAAALAAAAGNFSAAPRFYAAATSVAATQAVLDARIRLVGAVSATATAAASLNARITAQASAQASALASADLSVSQRVDANVSVTATAGASLTTSIKLAAGALSQAQAQAGLTVVKPLFASATAESSVVGDLKLTARFEASVAVVSTAYSAVLFVISANLGPPSGGGALARDNRQMIVARDFLRPRVQKDTPKILVPISTVAMLVDLDNNSMVVRQDTTVRVLPERSIVVVPKVNA